MAGRDRPSSSCSKTVQTPINSPSRRCSDFAKLYTALTKLLTAFLRVPCILLS